MVGSHELPSDPAVAARLEPFRKAAASAPSELLGQTSARRVRRYTLESPLGDFVSGVLRKSTGDEIAFENAGSHRPGLPEGTAFRPARTQPLPRRRMRALPAALPSPVRGAGRRGADCSHPGPKER